MLNTSKQSGGCPPIKGPIRWCPAVVHPDDCPYFVKCEENQICCPNGCHKTCYDPILKRFVLPKTFRPDDKIYI
ncbi:hypothetical protein Avbf_14418 [Armadillidium vulgare]|nr:hypothetical protein Avbf_14418 [Armadillidium vulgare]